MFNGRICPGGLDSLHALPCRNELRIHDCQPCCMLAGHICSDRIDIVHCLPEWYEFLLILCLNSLLHAKINFLSI